MDLKQTMRTLGVIGTRIMQTLTPRHPQRPQALVICEVFAYNCGDLCVRWLIAHRRKVKDGPDSQPDVHWLPIALAVSGPLSSHQEPNVTQPTDPLAWPTRLHAMILEVAVLHATHVVR